VTAKGIPGRVHLVGIGGIHMSAIAHVLLAWGHQVSGSDLKLSPLTERLHDQGATIYQGHAAGHLGDAELVAYTAAAQPDNPELTEAKRRGLPLLQRAEMIARLLEGRQAIAVAGSHGKTTTSALIVDLGTNARAGQGEHIVVEADEFAGAFLHYRPQVAVVTNIEPDHLDFYGSFQRLTAAFRQFMSQRIIRYGLKKNGEFFPENLSPKGICGYAFLLKYGEESYSAFETHLAGGHQVNNALAAIVVARVLGLPKPAVRAALARFRGVQRRFQFVGQTADITIMDDYAHHPTEISATVAAARERFPGRRLVCLFQPHTYSRTRYLLDGFRTCFQGVDQLLIAETYAAREQPSAGMSAQELAEAIESPPASYAGGLEDAPSKVLEVLQPGDIFFTIGAGDIDQVGPKVLEALRTGPWTASS